MLSQKELEKFSNKILEDYDRKNPSVIFKDKINKDDHILNKKIRFIN